MQTSEHRTTRGGVPGRAGRRVILGLCAALAAGGAACSRSGPAAAGAATTNEPAGEADMGASKTCLSSALAGSWYTADPAALRRELEAARAAAETPALEGVGALILPHAGYTYSGAVAAYGARLVAGHRYSRVVVLGPTHRVPMRNAIAVPEATHYRTILGEIPLDTAFLDRLRKDPMFRPVPGALPGEHSVEIEFPVLQSALGEFKLAPLVVGQLDDEGVRAAAAALRAAIDTNTLVVVSSDFTHYGPRFDYVPFATNVEKRLSDLDLGAFEQIRKRDVAGFRNYVEETGATICGRDPIAVLLAMLGGRGEVHLLKYDTSGRITGDWENVVSYVSAAVRIDWEPAPKGETAMKPTPPAPAAMEIPAADRAALLKLARATIAHYFEDRRKASPKDLGIPVTAGMRQVAGAFVTLHRSGDLRGCIGEIFPSRALVEAVQDHALNAAFRDPRFEPLSEMELPLVDLEISALAPPHEIGSWRDIVLGRHGIVLSKGDRQAVFLPQVAPEQGWDVATTLTHLAMKAGLPRDAWREGAKFAVFEAVVFGEKEGAR